MPAGFQNGEVASSATAANAPPMPTARAPTGIFRNSAASFVAPAGAAASSAKHAATRAPIGFLRMRLPVLSTWTYGRQRPYEPARSTVNRPVLGLPLGHARLADGLRDAPFSVRADELVSEPEHAFVARATVTVVHFVRHHHAIRHDRQLAIPAQPQVVGRRQEPHRAGHRHVAPPFGVAAPGAVRVPCPQRLPVHGERGAGRAEAPIHATVFSLSEERARHREHRQPATPAEPVACARKDETCRFYTGVRRGGSGVTVRDFEELEAQGTGGTVMSRSGRPCPIPRGGENRNPPDGSDGCLVALDRTCRPWGAGRGSRARETPLSSA